MHGRSDGDGLDLWVCQDLFTLRRRADGRITATNTLQLICIQVTYPTHLRSGLLGKVTDEIWSPVTTTDHCCTNLLHLLLLRRLCKIFCPYGMIALFPT